MLFKRALAFAAMALLATTSDVCAQKTEAPTLPPTLPLNTVCQVALHKSELPVLGASNVKIIPAPGEKDTAIAFYLAPLEGVPTLFSMRMGGSNYTIYSDPVQASLNNATVNNLYEVGVYKTRIVVVYSTQIGIRSVESYDGAKSFINEQFVRGYGASGPPVHMALTTFDGPTPQSSTPEGLFALVYYANSATGRPFAEYMNATGMWNIFGDLRANDSEAIPSGMDAIADGLIRMSMAYPLEDSDIDIATDGYSLMAVYDVDEVGLEAQVNSNNPLLPFVTAPSANATSRSPRDRITLATNGVRGTFLLVTRMALTGSVVAELTTDSGATWSAPRTLRIGNARGGSFGDGRRVSVIYTADGWVVSWVDYQTDVGSGAGGDVVFSTSTNGLLWTVPEIAVDGGELGTSQIGHSLVATSPTSYILTTNDGDVTNIYTCAIHDFVTNDATSVGAAVWSVAAAVAAVAVLANN